MNEALLAIELLTRLLAQASAVSDMLKAHQQNGTPIDLDALAAADDVARAALQQAISDAANRAARG